MVALQMATAAQTSARQEVLPFVMAAIVNVKPRATRILIVPSLSRVRPGRCHIAHHRTNTLVNAWHVRNTFFSSGPSVRWTTNWTRQACTCIHVLSINWVRYLYRRSLYYTPLTQKSIGVNHLSIQICASLSSKISEICRSMFDLSIKNLRIFHIWSLSTKVAYRHGIW